MNENTKMLRENRNSKYRIISDTIFTKYVIIKEVRNILSIK